VLELLRQRRWLGFTVFAVAMFVLCLVLANWQWQRYHVRQAENAQLDAALSADPVPVSALLTATPGATASPLPPELEWREVTATGRFDEAGEVAVRRRPLDGRNGFWIVTPLVTDTGVLLVNRGWVAAGTGATDVAPDVPPPPAGQVSVAGRLRPAEAPGPEDVPPPGQAWAVDPAALVVPASTPRFDAYVQLESATPPAAEGLTAPLPVPGHRGWNNLLYTFQWLIFAVVGAIGWWRLMRQESRREEPTQRVQAEAGA
jgi:cytochrome oxidase assembly protein ShyY1